MVLSTRGGTQGYSGDSWPVMILWSGFWPSGVSGVFYLGIGRVCTAFLAMISGETTSTHLGSIGSRLARPPPRQIDHCAAYACSGYRIGTISGGRDGKEGGIGAGGQFFYHGDRHVDQQ